MSPPRIKNLNNLSPTPDLKYCKITKWNHDLKFKQVSQILRNNDL